MSNVDLLKATGIFSQIAEEDLQKIEPLLREKTAGRDEVVCRQGDAGNALYIVQSGRIKSSATDPVGRERTVGFFTDGQAFGEMALLTGESYATTAQAAVDSKLLVLRKDDFDTFLAQNVQVMLQMMKVTADRQAHTTARPPHADEMSAPTGPGGGKVFTIFSPKGGVGKSTIAVNLAVFLARQHPDSVVLVDLSLTFGHDLLLLNLTTKSSLSATSGDALRKTGMSEGLAYYLAVHEPSSLRVLPGSTRPEDGETVSGETAKVAIEQLRRHFAYVVVDTSSTFGDPVLAALEQSDRVVMLCTPEMAVLRDVRECQRIFNSVVHLTHDRVVYVM
ncbi:MAG TPA: cyclic nucleotide-binding domain-containing protein, partial [Chloroflexota bacterium]